jgi:hypothetical protein
LRNQSRRGLSLNVASEEESCAARRLINRINIHANDERKIILALRSKPDRGPQHLPLRVSDPHTRTGADRFNNCPARLQPIKQLAHRCPFASRL